MKTTGFRGTEWHNSRKKMAQDEKIFQEVPFSAESDRILSDVVQTQTEIVVRLSESRLHITRALQFVSPAKLQVDYPEGPRPMIEHAVPMSFTCRDEKYFAQVFLQDLASELFLVIKAPLYKVQRRQSFRLRLPHGYPMKAQLFEINGHAHQEPVRVIDLSEGGCSLQVSRSYGTLVGAYLGLTVKIGNRPDFTQFGHVRYSRLEGDSYRLGIRFDQNKGVNSELFNLTRDLYVELFSKWARRR
ncbi:MAG: PilZ domain-containing protein [Bdellovibrionales bacterium]